LWIWPKTSNNRSKEADTEDVEARSAAITEDEEGIEDGVDEEAGEEGEVGGHEDLLEGSWFGVVIPCI
jgi:hypothetical protein